ncbi:UNVERIFIED_CONTAM: CRISPR/Cas system CSM-associated protein Csm3 (group 7 of RAMP superfamily) [Acetivibrio alkalicellulosi]
MNKIIERVYVSFDIVLVSPLSIGSGENQNTDMDIIRDCEEMPFIPASSICGVLRHWMGKSCGKDDENELFGGIPLFEDTKGRMSRITFYDAFLKDSIEDNKAKISVRDMVRLDINKSSDNKFDAEILEAGATFSIKFEISKRENDKFDCLKNIAFIMAGIEIDRVRLGRKTRRGFGKIKIDKDTINLKQIKFFNKENIREWIDFKWEDIEGSNTEESFIEMLNQTKEELEKNQDDITITADLQIKHSLMIRSYLRSKEFDVNTDYEQLKAYNEHGELLPVISGSSWAGAFRHHGIKLMLENGWGSKIDIIESGFGNEDKIKKAPSKIDFSESHVKDSTSHFLTRVKIDRFTGGAAESALFSEIPSFGGNTKLTINISSWKNNFKNAFSGLMLLILRDIYNGILAIGGETSIGRGIMNENDKEFFESVDIKGIEGKDTNEKYLNLLRCFVGYIKDEEGEYCE